MNYAQIILVIGAGLLVWGLTGFVSSDRGSFFPDDARIMIALGAALVVGGWLGRGLRGWNRGSSISDR